MTPMKGYLLSLLPAPRGRGRGRQCCWGQEVMVWKEGTACGRLVGGREMVRGERIQSSTTNTLNKENELLTSNVKYRVRSSCQVSAEILFSNFHATFPRGHTWINVKNVRQFVRTLTISPQIKEKYSSNDELRHKRNFRHNINIHAVLLLFLFTPALNFRSHYHPWRNYQVDRCPQVADMLYSSGRWHSRDGLHLPKF